MVVFIYFNTILILKILFSVSECKAKWHSLRSSYSRYVRDLKKIPRGSTVKRKKWHLADAMSFLDEFMGPQRSMTSKISMPDNENKYEVDDPNTNPLSQSGDSEDETVPMTDNPMISVTQERKKRRQSPAAEIVPDEYLQSVTVQSREEDDPNLLFFKSLLPDVEKLKPRNQRRFKSKVMDLLNTFLDSQEDSE